MSTARSTSTEPVRTLQASVLALRSWTARQRLAAVGFSVAFALLIGIPTVSYTHLTLPTNREV